MMRFLVVSLVLMMTLSMGFSVEKDEILGHWFTPGNNSTIKIYEQDGKYFGRISWLKYPVYSQKHELAGEVKKDLNNPDEKLRDREIKGLEILKEFKFNTRANRWESGKIYNPNDGNTYYCTIEMPEKDCLQVRGSIDAWGFLGKTQVWTKVESVDDLGQPILNSVEKGDQELPTEKFHE